MCQIADYDNVQLAFVKSCRGKQCKKEVKDFKKDYDNNIREICSSLMSGSISIGNYSYFKIYDPKERLICAASFRERVIHHAIMNICHKYFDRTLIYDTYATRKGKGGYKALDKAVASISKYRYIAKLDYKKYFDSIDHEILKKKLRRLFKDNRLLAIFDEIIDSYSVSNGRGLPIGNLTSQYFANYYLSSIDHHMKESIREPIYIRYMDDVLIMDNNRERLKKAVEMMRHYSTELKLHLKEPVYANNIEGVTFLGYLVKPYRLELNGKSKKRFLRKFKECELNFEKGIFDENEYHQHILPLMAFVEHSCSMSFRRNIFRAIGH